MDNAELAARLRETAALIELTDGNPYRARAFERAARTIRGLDTPVADYADRDALTDIDGVGDGLAGDIRDLLVRGSFDLRDELMTAVPAGLLDVLQVKGLGTAKVRTLWNELGITSIDELRQAAEAGQIETLDGFGAKTQSNILENAKRQQHYDTQRRYAAVHEATASILDQLRALDAVERAERSGALRRRLETLTQAKLIVVCDAPDVVREALAGIVTDEAPRPEGDDLVLEGAMADGFPLEIRLVPAERFGTAQWHMTGAADHCTAFEDAHGAPDAHADEADVYAAAGLSFVPPELREGQGELEAAAEDALPDLITFDDLRGTLHNHSTYSDGNHSLEAMAETARSMGLEYFGICDHSQSLSVAGGLSPDEVAEQQREIDRLNAQYEADGADFRIFSGIESDILADGSLDYAPDVLASFDLVVASVHSGFNMSEAEATERVVTAVQNPYTTILGHPTGRLLLRREGYPLDHERVIAACADHDVAIELNANPYRLDLDWRWVRRATEAGVRIAINPDAHATDELANMRWGVAAARKGWLTPAQCLNALSRDAFADWLARRSPQPAA